MKIISTIDLSENKSRSISLDRDLYSEEALINYLPTKNCISTIKKITTALDKGNVQRAWRIVGPYGSGKSALGVFFAQLTAGKDKFANTSEILKGASGDLYNKLSHSNRFSLAVVGSRISFGLALVNAILKAIEINGFKGQFIKNVDLSRKVYKELPFNAVCGEMLDDFLDTVTSNGYSGLNLIIDEVGKFVEFAALNPDEGDLISLQQVGELACKQGDDRLLVLALLHQHFSSYAAGVGRVLNEEWQKVSSRFEEVVFDEPVDQYLGFAKHALNTSLSPDEYGGTIQVSREYYSKAIELGLFNREHLAMSNIDVEKLYPIHPATLYAAAVSSKRFGQSERSFHAYIYGNETYGLRHFAEINEVGAWYTVADLFNYYAEGVELKFRDLAAERKWSFSCDIVSTAMLEGDSAKLLKVIAVLELVQARMITKELISYSAELPLTQTEKSLSELIDKGLLILRNNQQSYSIAIPDSVNIEAMYESVAKGDSNKLILDGINQLLSKRLIVANKHYMTTGTMRTLGVVAGTLNSWPEPSITQSNADGWLKLILIEPTPSAEERAKQRLIKDKSSVLEVSALLVVSPETKAALMEYSIWHEILEQLRLKRLDPWSTRYAEERLSDAAKDVAELVTDSLTSEEENSQFVYWYKGKPIEQSNNLNLSRLASFLFDAVYKETPQIINELVNKNKLSPAIVQARQRLFELLLKANNADDLFGDNEFPPERLIHYTLLEQKSLWCANPTRWTLQNPTKFNDYGFKKVWDVISVLLKSDELNTFAEIIEKLALPPYGVRMGPASIWLATYLLINRSKCAIFERGTLILELTPEHFQRLFKNPNIFTVREIEVNKTGEELLNDYRLALTTVGCTFGSQTSYLDLARTLILWFSKLPEYSRKTQTVSSDTRVLREQIIRAQDPIELLTKTIPSIHLNSKSDKSFKQWLTECLSSCNGLVFCNT